MDGREMDGWNEWMDGRLIYWFQTGVNRSPEVVYQNLN